MCLAVPGRVTAIDRSSSPLMGTVSFGGVCKSVCLEWLPEVREGEYVIVHVGFAISTVDEQEALETLRILREMGQPGDDGDAERKSQAPDHLDDRHALR